MPRLQVTTKSAEQVWASPDGQRTINVLTLDYNGKEVTAKTYSHDIAVVGWTGEVETYDKQGRNGPETFVKQPQKEGFGGGGGYKAPARAQATDNPFTMYLSYAKDIAASLIANKGAEGEFDEEEFSKIIDAVATGGGVLYASRPGDEEKAEPKTESFVEEFKEESNKINLEDIPIGDPFQGIDSL